jgi:hypothetical protein
MKTLKRLNVYRETVSTRLAIAITHLNYRRRCLARRRLPLEAEDIQSVT